MIGLKVFLICFNEAELIPHTVNHYKKMVPSCEITVHDNFSTDNSRELAMSLGCKIVDYDSGGKIDEFKLQNLKNNCWKGSDCDWVIVCDMDEWLCLTEENLVEMKKNKFTIVNTIGFDIVDNSSNPELSDLNPHSCSFGVRNVWQDKSICFDPNNIKEINYSIGAHNCNPTGVVKFNGPHLLKHMSWLGLPYRLARNRIRFERSEEMRKRNFDIHYINDENKISSHFNKVRKNSMQLNDKTKKCDCFWG